MAVNSDARWSAESSYATLPCPFCGQKPQAAVNSQGGAVYCDSPDCFGPRTTAQYLTDAVAQWNKRTPAGTADDYERRIREKVFASKILTDGEWVYLVGLFHMAREVDEIQSPDDAQRPVMWRVRNEFGYWHLTEQEALANTWRDIEKYDVQPLYLASQPPAAPVETVVSKIEAEARRYAGMYPEASDGRNTFVLFADWVARLNAPEPCEYCGPGVRTGLPSNACENCMNTGLKYPEHQRLSAATEDEEAASKRRDERREQFKNYLAKALVDPDNKFDFAKHPFPWTAGMVIYDGPGVQFFDANNTPVLSDLLRDQDDAATVLDLCNRLGAQPQPTPQTTVDPDGLNGCMVHAARALDYLADHERPIGGQSRYNAEHLMQIASELRRTSAAISALSRPHGGGK